MINCEIELDLEWSEACVISEIINIAKISPNPTANQPIANFPEASRADARFEINSTYLVSCSFIQK